MREGNELKILFPTLGSYGDVYPLLTLGRNLQQRGHEPIIVANPIYQSIVLKAGLDFIPLGQAQDYYDEINDPNIWHPTRGFQLVVEYGILRMLRPLYEIIRQFDPVDTIIVSSAFLFASSSVIIFLSTPFPFDRLFESIPRFSFFIPILTPGICPCKTSIHRVGTIPSLFSALSFCFCVCFC